MYGNGKDNVNLAFDPRDLKAILTSSKGINSTFSVAVDGGEDVGLARVAAFQKDPVRRTLVHADIQRLDPKRKLTFKVPLRLVDTGPAQSIGCKVRFITRHVKVNCLPEDVPAEITVSTKTLEPSTAIRLSDMTVDSKLTLMYKDNAPIVQAGSAPVAKAAEEG
jgi:large subunit ribosomal protein L25